MASIDSLQTLLVDELKDIYDAEQRLTKAIPKLAEASSNRELVIALNNHLAETQQHVARLEQAFSDLGEDADTRTCAGMKGLIKEGDDHAGDDYDDPGLRDAAIIGSAQRVEHYEIAAYGTAMAHAKLLGRDEIVRLLDQTLQEEKAADQILTDIAERIVNVNAAVRRGKDFDTGTRTTM
jgi:ferritin-like metal-binding protein YciE